jgi:D-alanyl-D-alanine carboxypeptidase
MNSALACLCTSAVLALFSLGCTGTAAPVAAPASGNDAGASDTAPPIDEACVVLRDSLQTNLNEARAAIKAKYVGLGVFTKRCGTQTFSANLEGAPAPTTPDTLFRIASISKTFLSATILKLVAAGKVSLDSPIDAWFPDFPKAKSITLKMLLNHTSGVADYLRTNEYQAARQAARSEIPSVDERIAWVKDVPFTHEPGKKWAYSNTNYLMAGRIVDKVTGSTWAKELRRATLDPVGLKNTFVYGEEPVRGGIAPGPDAHDLEWIGADGALVTTSADLLTWVRALYLDRTVLDAPSFNLMNTREDLGGVGYGLGLVHYDTSEEGLGESYGHSGGVLGFTSNAWAYPSSGTAIVALVAKDQGDVAPVVLGAAKAVLELPQ